MLYVVAILAALAVLAGVGAKGYLLGREAREPEIVEMRLVLAAAERAAAEAEAKGKKAAAAALASYRAKASVIRVEAENTPQIVEVIRRETPADCVLPPAYRRLWDGESGSGEAADTARTDGTPVAVADAAQTAAEARRRFEDNSAKLEALQQLVREHGNNKQQD